jgi:hypothetical protein
MNPAGLLILLVPALGLIPIVDQRSWRITPWLRRRLGAGPGQSALLDGLFWLGWIGSLVVGIVVLVS